MAPTPRGTPNMDTSRLYDNDRYSDLLIKFSGCEIKAHRFVLCEQNEYFLKLCGPDSQFAEAKEAEVTLLDDDPDAVEAFIRSLYNFDLETFGRETLPPMIDRARFYCNVVVVADKYGAEALTIFAANELGDHLENATPVDILASLELVTEEYGDYEGLQQCAWDTVFSRLEDLIPLDGFPTWLASQPLLFKNIMGSAARYRILERQGLYKCSACKRELVCSMDRPAPQCCRQLSGLVGNAVRMMESREKASRGGARGGPPPPPRGDGLDRGPRR